MGRNKIPIKKLEPASQRRGTFKYKRSEGIKKKAKELSILSDAQVLLLLCDPNGQYHVTCHGVNSTFDGVVQKFLSESQKNLDDSRRDRMEILQKSYKKDSHAINAISLMDHGMKAINKNHSSLEIDTEHIKQEISTIESQLGPLRKINEIDAIERFDELTEMECSIMELLSKNEEEMVHIVQQEESGYPDQWDNLPATNYGDNYQMFNPTPFSYQRDPMASTSTALPMLPFSSMGGMEQLERVESIPTAMYNRDPMASTSTALPMLPFSSMGGMEQLERVESIPTAMYNRDPMASTSTALPMRPFSSMGGMEQLERVESIPTAMYNRDPMASTSTALPMLPFSSMGGMEQLERVESIPTAMYNRDPMASTSTALPMRPFSSMGGMEQLERVESTPTAMYNRGQLREDSSFQLSDSDCMMLCEWTRGQG